MKKYILIFVAVVSAVAMSSCNTMSGLGRDVSRAGSAVTEAANDAR